MIQLPYCGRRVTIYNKRLDFTSEPFEFGQFSNRSGQARLLSILQRNAQMCRAWGHVRLAAHVTRRFADAAQLCSVAARPCTQLVASQHDEGNARYVPWSSSRWRQRWVFRPGGWPQASIFHDSLFWFPKYTSVQNVSLYHLGGACWETASSMELWVANVMLHK